MPILPVQTSHVRALRANNFCLPLPCSVPLSPSAAAYLCLFADYNREQNRGTGTGEQLGARERLSSLSSA